MLKVVENELWHPKNSFINMKTNTRIFYSIMMTALGVSAIKNIYIYYLDKNELSLDTYDYSIIGAICGLYTGQILLGSRFLLVSLFMGTIYGISYSLMISFMVKRRREKAKKLGINL